MSALWRVTRDPPRTLSKLSFIVSSRSEELGFYTSSDKPLVLFVIRKGAYRDPKAPIFAFQQKSIFSFFVISKSALSWPQIGQKALKHAKFPRCAGIMYTQTACFEEFVRDFPVFVKHDAPCG